MVKVQCNAIIMSLYFEPDIEQKLRAEFFILFFSAWFNTIILLFDHSSFIRNTVTVLYCKILKVQLSNSSAMHHEIPNSFWSCVFKGRTTAENKNMKCVKSIKNFLLVWERLISLKEPIMYRMSAYVVSDYREF